MWDADAGCWPVFLQFWLSVCAGGCTRRAGVCTTCTFSCVLTRCRPALRCLAPSHGGQVYRWPFYVHESSGNSGSSSSSSGSDSGCDDGSDPPDEAAAAPPDADAGSSSGSGSGVFGWDVPAALVEVRGAACCAVLPCFVLLCTAEVGT